MHYLYNQFSIEDCKKGRINMKKYIALKDNLERIFLLGKTKTNSYTLKKGKHSMLIEEYNGFSTVNIDEIITIFYFFDETEKTFNDFIDITLNEKYLLKNILRGSLKKINVVIEGADGVGKSTLVRQLANKGYITQDRAVREVTQKMREEISNKERIESVKEYLYSDKKRKLIFLFLSNEKELEGRINMREKISEYDKKALIFQRLYVDTYNQLSNIKNLYIIDCLGKTPLDLVDEIEKLI